MRMDPALCRHTSVKKSARVETVSVPELGIEQLCLRVRVYCGDCREAFTPKTMLCGFSTEEIGVVGDELFVPLEPPVWDEVEVSEDDVDPARAAAGTPLAARNKEHLH